MNFTPPPPLAVGPFRLDLGHPQWTNGFQAGMHRYRTGYQHRILSDEDVYHFCLRNCLDRHDPDRYNVGYLTGWLTSLVGTPPVPGPAALPPTSNTLTLGAACLLLLHGEAFRTGSQIGHLAFERQLRRKEHAEVSITSVILATLDLHYGKDDEVLSAGLVTGWLLTAYQRGWPLVHGTTSRLPDAQEATR